MSKTPPLTMTIGYDGKRAVQNMTGLGNYSRLVVSALSALYPRNRYVLFAPRERENPRLTPILEQPNVELRLPQGRLMRKFPAWWRTVEMVHDWLPAGIDLYHGLSNELPLTAGLAPVATVVTIHDLIWRKVPQDYSAIDRRLYEYKYSHSARVATRVIAISERTKADMIEAWGIDESKIDVVYQGCDAIFSRPTGYEDKLRVRQRYGLPGRYMLSVGTVQSRKNQLLAVKALPYIAEDVSLAIVGRADGPYRRLIEAEIERLGVGSRVKWLSDVPFDDLPALYAAAELSAYPSRYEGFGIPLIESLQSGTPVVAATGSCLEEAGGPGGIYVDPDDVRGFGEAATALLSQPWRRQMMADKGRRYASRFSHDAFARGLMATYSKTILDYNNKE